MNPSPPQSTGISRIQTDTWTSHPTTLKPKKQQSSASHEPSLVIVFQVTTALQSNGYPLKFIRNWFTPAARASNTNTPQTSSIVLPYIRGVSEAIRRILAQTLCQDQFQASLNPAPSLGKCKGFCTPQTEIRCSLLHS